MPFVVPDIARFTYHGTIEDRNWANIVDMQIDTTGTTTDRDDAIDDQAGILINEFCDHLLPFLIDDFTFTSVTYVDLNTAVGITGERTSTSQETLPQAGPTTAQPLPANVSVLVRKVTPSRRGARSGRFYWCGHGDDLPDVNNGNNVNAANLATMQTAWNSWKGNVEQTTGAPSDYDSFLAVSHILTRDPEGNPLTGDYTLVTSMSVQQRFATQRRRLR